MGDLAISKITNENVKLTNYRLIGIPLPVVMHVITIPIRSSQIVPCVSPWRMLFKVILQRPWRSSVGTGTVRRHATVFSDCI